MDPAEKPVLPGAALAGDVGTAEGSGDNIHHPAQGTRPANIAAGIIRLLRHVLDRTFRHTPRGVRYTLQAHKQELPCVWEASKPIPSCRVPREMRITQTVIH